MHQYICQHRIIIYAPEACETHGYYMIIIDFRASRRNNHLKRIIRSLLIAFRFRIAGRTHAWTNGSMLRDSHYNLSHESRGEFLRRRCSSLLRSAARRKCIEPRASKWNKTQRRAILKANALRPPWSRRKQSTIRHERKCCDFGHMHVTHIDAAYPCNSSGYRARKKEWHSLVDEDVLLNSLLP